MADIAIGDIQTRLSGGGGNTDPNASLGGVKSSEIVLSQSSSALSNVTGVVINNVVGAPVGDGTIFFFAVAVVQVQTLTIDAALVALNVIAVDVDGVAISETFATDSNTTLAAFAASIQAEPGIVTAVVTDAGGGSDDDREIIITALVAGVEVVLENEDVTLGASQAGIVQAVTTGNAAVDSLSWVPFGGSAAVNAQDVSVDDTYTIVGSDASFLVVTVTSASLPGTDQNDVITIANIANEIFDDVAKVESAAGDVEYRGLYLHNAHSTDTATDVRIWIKQDSTGPDTIAIGVDPEGVGDGAATGIAVIIANEGAAPVGVVFTAPVSQAAGLSLGTFGVAQSAAFWIRRTVPSANTVSAPNALSRIGISALL